MLSNKLTFSLASLIVLLMIGLCFPVAAQTVALSSGETATIASGGFVVIGRGDLTAANTALSGLGITPALTDANYLQMAELPDLEEFFALGGTVELIITTADADTDAAGNQLDDAIGAVANATNHRKPVAKDLVISEIMWGLDVDPTSTGVNFDLSDRKQWIEIYNTTDLSISIDVTPDASVATDGAVTTAGSVSVSLKFTAFTNQTTASANNMVTSDAVSNVHLGKWTLPGSSGVTELIDRQNAPTQSNIVSAYRNIDYAKVKGIHKLGVDNRPIADQNRVEQLKGVPNGRLSGSWKATPVDGSRNMMRWHIGTPGMMHIMDTAFTFDVPVTSVLSNSVVINEVHDNPDNSLDWVELYNNGTESVDLHGWELSYIHGAGAKAAPNASITNTDIRLVGKEKGDSDDSKRFPKGFKLKPKEYLLIVNRHPKETVLANGINIDEVAAGTEVNAGASHQYIVRPELKLPNAAFTLILRSHLEKNAQHDGDNTARTWYSHKKFSENIMDFAGTHSIAVTGNKNVPTADQSLYNTLRWPLRGWDNQTADTGKDGAGNRFPTNTREKSWARKGYAANRGHHKDTWEEKGVGAKGGLGYDPGVDLRYAPGTPGYANNAIKDQLVDDKDTAATSDDVAFMGAISISEVMVDAGPRWNLIQWIELYNSSMTEAINLKDWELEIRNATDEVESYVDSGFEFNDAFILPNQTLLIVSGQAVNDVADNRVYNLHQHHRRQLGLTNRRSVLLSPTGFYLKLTDKNDDMVDEAGNVMVDGAARNVQWDLPARSPDMRRSLVRQYGSRELYDGQPDMADDGTMMESWRQSDITGAGISFYGHRDDVSTPGYRLGGPLPVTLSKFRPVRNQDTGHVDITWITQSELNNAGFNILRSEAKNGEFKVINVKGIVAGHGTTSEKHVYTFTDTTAKPNVVYYYQIEDVSINGLRTTLTTTHLRGHVGAAGKLTTRWGELKSSVK